MTYVLRRFITAGLLWLASPAAGQQSVEQLNFMELARKVLAGDATAANNIGYAFGKGDGVRLSPPQAYKWFHVASLLDPTAEQKATALRNRDLAGQLMQPDAIQALQEEASTWVGKLREQTILRALAQIDSTPAPTLITRSDVYARHGIADVRCSSQRDIVDCRTVDDAHIEPLSCAELMLDEVFWPC
jgi:hypothetical protein